jgi:tRNA isopentenyl-2-thiomethyl-A-37 hydroxylase MiaE
VGVKRRQHDIVMRRRLRVSSLSAKRRYCGGMADAVKMREPALLAVGVKPA